MLKHSPHELRCDLPLQDAIVYVGYVSCLFFLIFYDDTFILC